MKITITSLFVLLVVISCKDNSINPISGNTFYPLNVGNKWVYDYKSFDSLGVTIIESQFDETLPIKVIKENLLVYEYDTPLHYVHNDKLFIQNKSDGVHFLVGSLTGAYFYSDRLTYKYPCNENDFFVNGRNNEDTTIVVSINDTVICEAGIFNCIVYRNRY